MFRQLTALIRGLHAPRKLIQYCLRLGWMWIMAGMSNMRPAGRMRPFASTPAARTKDTLTAKVAIFII
jgi:hypothetical protein